MYTYLLHFGDKIEFWLYIKTSYIANAIASIWLSMLVTLYLSKIEREIPGEGRGALDIVLAFFGGYSKAQRLERDLAEWEGRYRMGS